MTSEFHKYCWRNGTYINTEYVTTSTVTNFDARKVGGGRTVLRP